MEEKLFLYIFFFQAEDGIRDRNVTGVQTCALPIFPLGMQILGRPFGEETILRIGHAYEQATEWHTRRPRLVAGASAPEVVPPPVLSMPADHADAETRDLCVK